jgi:hypothetical protein
VKLTPTSGPACACACLVLLLVPAAQAGAADIRPESDDSPLGTERLSDEFKITRFAHALTRAKIRSKPSRTASSRGVLRYQTEDDLPEPYPVLRSQLDAKKRVWLQIRIPARPNNRTGWVERSALTEFHVVRTHLKIDRRALRATLYRSGKKIWTSRIGIGGASTPTPAGRFIVREVLKSLGGAYGPWAFGTSAYSVLSDWPGGGVVGMHGTNQPELIPGRPSHGCIRVPNPKIVQLKKLMPIGTPVRIV